MGWERKRSLFTWISVYIDTGWIIYSTLKNENLTLNSSQWRLLQYEGELCYWYMQRQDGLNFSEH